MEASQFVLEDPEFDALPGFAVQRVVQEVLLVHERVVEGDGKRVMAGCCVEFGLDVVERVVGDEGDAGAVAKRGVAFADWHVLLAEEGVGRERGAPTGQELGVVGGARPRSHGAAFAREGVEAHACRVFAPRGAVVPAALAEGEQQCGIGDPVAVVGNRDAVAELGDGVGDDVDAGGVAAASVLEKLAEDL